MQDLFKQLTVTQMVQETLTPSKMQNITMLIKAHQRILHKPL